MLRLISAACLLALANSLRCGAPLRVGSPRSTVVAQAQECALIVLKSEDPVAIAKLLKKAWIEGGMKRGLAGAVLIPDEPGAVHIVAEGQNGVLLVDNIGPTRFLSPNRAGAQQTKYH